jgi:cytochrome d ubiquinol oxidase subunit II
MLAGIGIVLRGSAFAFRKWASRLRYRRIFGIAFAGSSLMTPFFFGTVAGGVASGRIPLGNAAGDPWTSWLNPTSLLGGVLAVVVAAYVAAVLAARDAAREDRMDLAPYFRTRALASGLVAGVVATIGIFVIRADAPVLFDGLTDTYGGTVVLLSVVAGTTSLVAIYFRRRQVSRIAAVAATVTILWGWGLGQYPWLLPNVLTIEEGAATDAVLVALLLAFVGAALLAVPALIWLYALTDSGTLDTGRPVRSDTSEALLQDLVAAEAAAPDDE